MKILKKIKTLIISFLNIVGLGKVLNLIRNFLTELKIRNEIFKIDSKEPFNGPLKENGIAITYISMEAINGLLQKYKKFNKKIHLSKEDIPIIKEIFFKIGPLLKEYFGDKVFLDGMCWKQNISNKFKSHDKTDNWHTDSVGCRVKCFICIIGDGTVPTLILPSKKRIPNFFYWLKGCILGSIRFQGIKNQKLISTLAYEIKHKKGSVALFDTQLIHRGGYKKNSNERTSLVLEFSNPTKHDIINRFFPAIGTFDNYNSFTFDKELIEVEIFSQFLDPSRLKRDQSYSKKIYSNNRNR